MRPKYKVGMILQTNFQIQFSVQNQKQKSDFLFPSFSIFSQKE